MGGCMVAAAVLLSQTPFGFGGGVDFKNFSATLRCGCRGSNAFRRGGRGGLEMSEEKFTPGPWSQTPFGFGGGVDSISRTTKTKFSTQLVSNAFRLPWRVGYGFGGQFFCPSSTVPKMTSGWTKHHLTVRLLRRTTEKAGGASLPSHPLQPPRYHHIPLPDALPISKAADATMQSTPPPKPKGV